MPPRWTGPIMVLLILGGVALVLLLNLNLKGINPRPPGVADAESPPPPTSRDQPPPSGNRKPAGFREWPIGDEVERHQMRIAAVWLPPVQMAGMAMPASSDMIHIEADIKATEGNKNGCPKDEFIPYLTVRYLIVPEDAATAKSVESIRGDMMPMVASDGWHYGASISMPRAGRYKLTYRIEPPSAGRHSDPATGVDPWWKPFEVSYDWDYRGP